MAVFDKLAAGLENKYRIERELGAGGMALVFLARDVRHDRPVALKLLRPELSAILGGERFLAEIRTTANLQHPHILPLHDSGEVDGLVYYVMPFVEGESLRDRLNREKQLPVEDAVRIAREVASALDYAHRRGVVHRDIKPENILLHDGQALVADFGIALAASRSDGSTRITETGMSLGTPQYMAPEQAMGDRDITPKADIYALGCVLYEMLVGEAPFAGPNPQAIVARMLTEQPRGLTVQRQTVPPNVEGATLKALQKLPADRFASAAQFSDALGNAGYTAPHFRNVKIVQATRREIPLVARIIATAVISALLTGIVMLKFAAPDAPPPSVVRFTIPVAGIQGLSGLNRRSLAVAPDGREFVFAAPYSILRRLLSDSVFTPIPGTVAGTTNLANPVYSPDGKSIAYWYDGAIRTIPVTGGTPTKMAQTVNPLGMDWGESGIVYTSDNDIFRVSKEGEDPELLVDLPLDHTPLGPQLLPGGTRVLFTLAEGAAIDRWERAGVFVQDLETGKRTLVLEGGADARYVSTGHVMYALGGSVFAVPFDVRSLKALGPSVSVLEGVRRGPVGAIGTAQFAVSNGGTLVYVPGPATIAVSSLDLALTGRNGDVETLGLPAARYGYPRVSPDGRRIAVESNEGSQSIVWVYDLDRSSAIRRLTLGGKERYPIWSSDGQWVAFQSTREGDAGIWRQRADGSGTGERLTQADSGAVHIPESWSPTRNALLYSITRRDTTRLFLYSLDSKTSTPFGDVVSVGNLVGATFSPDGKWVAYSTAERSNTTENFVFVQPFPATGARYQISQSGENGHHPMWSRDQKELYYVPLVNTFVVRSITTTNTVTFGNPAQVPRTFPTAAPATPRTFDITRDGRVIGILPKDLSGEGRRGGGAALLRPGATPEVTVVVNWFEELKAKVRRN